MKLKEKIEMTNEKTEFCSNPTFDKLELVKVQDRYNEAEQAMSKISAIAWESDETAEIFFEPDNLAGTSMVIEIKTNLVVVDELKAFCEVLDKANNMVIYPQKDGRVGIGIIFEGCYEWRKQNAEPLSKFHTDKN